jgi:ABC-type uncharacterized transport system ATPase subunit
METRINTFLKRELNDRLTVIENLIINSRHHLENLDYLQVIRNFESMKERIDGKIELKKHCL